MTTTQNPEIELDLLGDDIDDEHPPTAAKITEFRREETFLPDSEATDDAFPRMNNMSAGFFYDGIIRPERPEPPEYVAIDMPDRVDHHMLVAVTQWNMLWESAQFTRRYFEEDDLPAPLWDLADLGDNSITFVPRTRTRYFEYAPLLHMLPKHVIDRFGLPTLRPGQWPFLADFASIDDLLPVDLEMRLAKAWAWVIWPHLNSGSRLQAFTADDPIKMLAHNLDFWVPAVTRTIQDRLSELPEVDKGRQPGPVTLVDGSVLEGATSGDPRMGGDIWTGAEDAAYALEETVWNADETGQLRGILDAVRSNRVEDDFSPQWSYAREDFERKLHGKRRKVKVAFVELPDTIPVQSAESDIVGNVITNDFLTLLDTKSRTIVVLLNSGATKTEIARQLGYANHSPVSKRLAKIRKMAEEYFDASS